MYFPVSHSKTSEKNVPVKLEIITAPTDADWQDLAKIHQETASNGLTKPCSELQHWLTSYQWIFAGRFNDRIIGVMLAEQQQQTVYIHSAAVRTITQRRGVMHQMLHFIQKWASDQQVDVVITECPEAFIPALKARNFQHSNNQWIFYGSK